ncbi:MAG: hypothetical protein LBI79_00365 [Nitrososphaerota archaeon]|nr:hypothetical protein [Nitrososphaerota archaeon]
MLNANECDVLRIITLQTTSKHSKQATTQTETISSKLKNQQPAVHST